MPTTTEVIWKSPVMIDHYLSEVRCALPFGKEQIDLMLLLVGSLDIPVGNILDLGCGDGILGAALLEEFKQTRAVFMDFSEDMLRAAKSKLRPFQDRTCFVNEDYSTGAWLAGLRDKGPFDAIVSGYSIHHQQDQRKKELYAELSELLNPGGLFLNIEHVLSPSNWIESISDHYVIDCLYTHEIKRRGVRSRSEIEVDYQHRPDKGANILSPVEQQCGWLREMGYVDVDCYFKFFEFAVFGGRKPKA